MYIHIFALANITCDMKVMLLTLRLPLKMSFLKTFLAGSLSSSGACFRKTCTECCIRGTGKQHCIHELLGPAEVRLPGGWAAT